MNKYKKILLGRRFVHACSERVFKGIRMHERKNGGGENERVSEKDSQKGKHSSVDAFVQRLWCTLKSSLGIKRKNMLGSSGDTCNTTVAFLRIASALLFCLVIETEGRLRNSLTTRKGEDQTYFPGVVQGRMGTE